MCEGQYRLPDRFVHPWAMLHDPKRSQSFSNKRRMVDGYRSYQWKYSGHRAVHHVVWCSLMLSQMKWYTVSYKTLAGKMPRRILCFGFSTGMYTAVILAMLWSYKDIVEEERKALFPWRTVLWLSSTSTEGIHVLAISLLLKSLRSTDNVKITLPSQLSQTLSLLLKQETGSICWHNLNF